VLGHHAGGVDLAPGHQERAGIEQYGVERRVHRVPTAQQQQAGLAGDGDPHLVGELEAGTADKFFLVQELLHQPFEPLPERGRHPAVLRHVALEDGDMARRERTRQHAAQAPAGGEPGQHDGGRQGQAGKQGFHQAAPRFGTGLRASDSAVDNIGTPSMGR
jgi:hypothetical protein